ncbi:MAG: signal peptide peptidase SppA [Pseudomonadota bacterium]
MSDLYDATTERRPKRRLFTFWRAFWVLALIAFVWGANGALQVARDAADPPGPYVALHEVVGVITVDPERDALLRALASDPDARALVLRVDSPGGTTTGAEALFETVREISASKPVVALMGEVAASGGYIAAIASDHIIARGNTLTGSIGVVRQRPNISGLLDRLGIRIDEERSDEFKANPSFVSDGTIATRAWDEEVLQDAYGWFRGLVADRRGLEGAQLDLAANGRVFTGRQALERGLIDQIGGPVEARGWLADQGVDPSLPTRRIEKIEIRPLWMRVLGVRLPDGGLALETRMPIGQRLYSILN